MLVLTRHEGKRIIIGDDITITVLGSYRGQVKIGVEAPKGISVYREEVYLNESNKLTGKPSKTKRNES